MGNNPISIIDPTGMSGKCYCERDRQNEEADPSVWGGGITPDTYGGFYHGSMYGVGNGSYGSDRHQSYVGARRGAKANGGTAGRRHGEWGYWVNKNYTPTRTDENGNVWMDTPVIYAQFIPMGDLAPEDGQAISIGFSGAYSEDGIGYSVGYFWGENTDVFFITKLIPDGEKNIHLNLSIDYAIFSSADETEVTFDEILGFDAIVQEDILGGYTFGESVPHFNKNRSYGPGFQSPYRLTSWGAGFSGGYSEYKSSTLSMSYYFNWLKNKLFGE